MRWARFDQNGTPAYGVVEGDEIIPVRGSPFDLWERTSTRLPLSGVKLLVPVIPPTFYLESADFSVIFWQPVPFAHGRESTARIAGRVR